MNHYLFAIDADGNEIAGTRRNLEHCSTPRERWDVEQALLAQIGEDCFVRVRRPDGSTSS